MGSTVFRAGGLFLFVLVANCSKTDPSSDEESTALAQLPLAGPLTSESNARSELSPSHNPSGGWTYGTRANLNASFVAFSQSTSLQVGALVKWSNAASEPYVMGNVSGATQSMSTIHVPRSALILHPGPAGQRSVVRWTAPQAATIQLAGRFEGVAREGTSSDVAVTHNNAILFSGNLDGFGHRLPFKIQRSVMAGDRIELSVGVGPNGTYYSDSTALWATINPVQLASGDASVVDDYSEANNPTGVWSYGYRSPATAPFVRYTSHGNPYGSNFDTWSRVSGCCPHITHNRTFVTQTFSSFTLPPDQLNLHPGPNGERSVARWTASINALVRIAGAFEGIDETTSDVRVVQSGAVLYQQNLNGRGALSPFSLLRAVDAGEVVEFSVGFGSNGTYYGDSTGLRVQIVPVVTSIGDTVAPTDRNIVQDPGLHPELAPIVARSFGADPSLRNPGGVWSYGYRTATNAFTLYPAWDFGYGSSLLSWNRSLAQTTPHATVNLANGPQTFSTFTVPSGYVNLHPGPDGERSVVRWAAPMTGIVRLQGQFLGLGSDTTTDVQINDASAVLWSSTINGRVARSFAVNVSVVRGDSLDLSVGFGANGTYFGDSTGLTVSASYPSVIGDWSPVTAWPFVAIHASLLPNGKVLMWTKRANYTDVASGGTQVRLWDPTAGTVVSISAPPGAPLPTDPENTTAVRNDIFCADQTLLADGKLLVVGGAVQANLGIDNANIFDPATNQWTAVEAMNLARWYPTVCPLSNGEALVLGLETNATDAPPQVWKVGGGWRPLAHAVSPYARNLDIYNFLHLAPNGQVFVSGPDPSARYLDPVGDGGWSSSATSNGAFRDYGSSVLFADGKVLLAGGGAPMHTAEVIDLNAPSPAWRYTGSMANARRHFTTTLLPDGTVLATGGTSGPGYDSSTPVLETELWDPTTQRFSTLAPMKRARLYHSVALLLPDATVMTAGGGLGGTPDVTRQPNVEIFSPPYLFQGGTRPVITSAPSAVAYGATFFVATSSAISRVTWIRLGAVTHGFNTSQRLNTLAFVSTAGGLNVTAPTNANLAPPGHYMLFLLDAAGVPSIAKIIHLQ